MTTMFVYILLTLTINLTSGSSPSHRAASWRKTGLKDIFFNNLPSSNASATSVRRCAIVCLDTRDDCLAFAFQEPDEMCLIYSRRPILFELETTVAYTGLVYYWTYVGCPETYIYKPEVHLCFKIYISYLAIHNQRAAQGKCKENDAHLFVMSSQKRMEFMFNYVLENVDGNHNFYLGAYEDQSTGNYMWFDGHRVDESFWDSDQPVSGEKCIVAKHKDSGYRLSSVSCSSTWHYICEVPVR